MILLPGEFGAELSSPHVSEFVLFEKSSFRRSFALKHWNDIIDSNVANPYCWMSVIKILLFELKMLWFMNVWVSMRFYNSKYT